MLWGSRFKVSLDDKILDFSSSLKYDKKLAQEDIAVSIAHAKMLNKISIVTNEELGKILTGLKTISEECSGNEDVFDDKGFEDIHSAIEAKLQTLIGKAGEKLHSGRSRNDQVVTDMRLWIRKSLNELHSLIRELQLTLVKAAEDNIDTLMPGYTHMQRAQVVSFGHHLLAYVEMFERDFKRFTFVSEENDSSPLGAGALAGSTLPLDREYTAKELGFSRLASNSMDAVSDRDFLLDFLNAISISAIHLSRLADEIIIWTSTEWKFVKPADEHMTGSSLMPNKKNPDPAELIRGKSGKLIGSYISLANILKGIPLTYFRDLQEDKEIVFSSFDTYKSLLEIMTILIDKIEVNKERFTEELKKDFLWATDLADWLVIQNVPFREAHGIVGNIVKSFEEKVITSRDVTLNLLKEYNPVFDESALECFNLSTSLQRKKTIGSPNPEFVKSELKKWKDILVK